MKPIDEKVYKNALITEKLIKLTPQDKQQMVIKLLATKSERELGLELGIPHSTLHDWKTLRQDNTGNNIHISLSSVYRKLKEFTPKDITDWGRLEQIRDLINDLLRKRSEGKE